MIVIGQRRSKRAFFSNFRTDRKMPDLWASERKIFFFLLFTGLVLVENYITCQAGLSPIKPFHNLRTLLSQNRNKKRTNLLNPESNRFSLKCKFAINDYSVNTSLFFGGKFEVKFEILLCWQRSNCHPICTTTLLPSKYFRVAPKRANGTNHDPYRLIYNWRLRFCFKIFLSMGDQISSFTIKNRVIDE